MILSLSRWRPGHLLAAWSAYWAGLAAVTLTPTIVAIIQATTRTHGKSAVSASFGNTLVSITVTEGATQTFSASAHLLPIALWIAVPPLVLYAIWLRARPRVDAAAAPTQPVMR